MVALLAGERAAGREEDAVGKAVTAAAEEVAAAAVGGATAAVAMAVAETVDSTPPAGSRTCHPVPRSHSPRSATHIH